MDLSQRIQLLRKGQGLSQEELADRLGVSRQAVSKWESGQSVPDLERRVAMSELFSVTTDHILKGAGPEPAREPGALEVAGRVLYVLSAALMAIGLFCGFGGWHEQQTMQAVWGAMVIQAVGAGCYFIGRLLAPAAAPGCIGQIDLAAAAFMPVSMLCGLLSLAIFRTGWASPYPVGALHWAIFAALYPAILLASHLLARGRARRRQPERRGE